MTAVNIFCFFTAVILVAIRAYLKYLENKDRQSGKIIKKEEYQLTGLLYLSIRECFSRIKNRGN